MTAPATSALAKNTASIANPPTSTTVRRRKRDVLRARLSRLFSKLRIHGRRAQAAGEVKADTLNGADDNASMRPNLASSMYDDDDNDDEGEGGLAPQDPPQPELLQDYDMYEPVPDTVDFLVLEFMARGDWLHLLRKMGATIPKGQPVTPQFSSKVLWLFFHCCE
jgi:hypothetical protein